MVKESPVERSVPRKRRNPAYAVFTLLVLAGGSALAADKTPIRVGDIESFSTMPVGTKGYRQGWQLAQDELNAKGGILGRPLEVLNRDDQGKPDVAITQANGLISSDKVDFLTGGSLSNIGLALTDFANYNKVLYLASQPITDAVIWEKGNPYTFRLRPSTYTQTAILAAEAAKLPAKRWAIIAPNYEFGQASVARFKAEMKRLKPDVEFVSEQWPPLGKIDAGAVIQATVATNPDAIFNATFGADLVKLVREGNSRGAFKGREVASVLTGEPEYLVPLKAETPVGWLVTGYPVAQITRPEHVAFVDAYKAKFNELPNYGALMGYMMVKVIEKAVTEAGGTDTAAMIKAVEKLEVDTPVGRIHYRAIDHQSTMGDWVGRLSIKDGEGLMTDWKYVDGADVQPSDDFVRKARP